ncbi:NAD-dependent epimerase/dehydratase family protein [Pseudomonadales bacterium]|nr:NAD-dependent epimerase/dehydratase family protein [Pseudomonadales bacterium]
MKVLITGAHGFIGKNLGVHLAERKEIDLVEFGRDDAVDSLSKKLVDVDFVFHLAGVNRPKHIEEFTSGNSNLTATLCQAIIDSKRKIPVIYTSSVQAALDNPYGASKKSAERTLMDFSDQTGSPVYLFRLPNVFGKWCKPNYNSVVGTFCHNIAHDLPIQVNDPTAAVRLVYIDDVVNSFISIMDGAIVKSGFVDVNPVYEETVGSLADKIYKYKESRLSLISEPVGTGFDRALYSSYLSYLKPDKFSYELVKNTDSRGVFVEMLKTKDSGQFSYFTAHPGITRGEHYHHTKTEKFLVVKGDAVFKFRHVLTDEIHEIRTAGDVPQVVETIPGWTHDITNIGNQEMVVLLWANEIFDRDNPDTYAKRI